MTKDRTRFDAVAEELEDKPLPPKIKPQPDEDDDYGDDSEVEAPAIITKPPDANGGSDRPNPKTYLSARGRIYPVDQCEITSIEFGVDGREAYQPFYGWSERGRSQRFEIDLRIPMMIAREQLGEELESALVINEIGGPTYFKLRITKVANTMTATSCHTNISATADRMIR